MSKIANGSDRLEVRGTDSEWSLFFTDLDELLCEYEQHQSTSDICLKENVTIRLENAVQALQTIAIGIRCQQGSSSRNDQEFSVDVLELLSKV